MVTKLLSQMSRIELLEEMIRCQEKGKEALEEGMLNEYQVLEKRYYLAKSYTMDPCAIVLNATYGIENDTNLFIVNELRGVMAYGHAIGQEEEIAYPIGMLIEIAFPKDHSSPKTS